MAVIVIAGQARNVGKTALACAILRAFPERHWTAVKITPHTHTTESTSPDTERFLAAGARRAVLLESPDLEHDIHRIDAILAAGGDVLIESNTVLLYHQPDVAFLVTSNAISEVKPSAIAILDRVHAVVSSELTEAMTALIRSKLATRNS